MLKQKKCQFTILLSPQEEGGFTVEVPALPGCVTEGDSLEEAKKNAYEAIELYCETLIKRGLPIPEDADVNFFKAKIEVPLKLQTA